MRIGCGLVAVNRNSKYLPYLCGVCVCLLCLAFFVTHCVFKTSCLGRLKFGFCPLHCVVYVPVLTHFIVSVLFSFVVVIN